MNAEPALSGHTPSAPSPNQILSNLEPAIKRLASLAPLDPDEQNALLTAASFRRRFGPHREILAEGKPIQEGGLILQGWACRSRIFRDGRRQILGFLVPGDLIGVCPQPQPVATTMITTITELTLCQVPPPSQAGPGLTAAYAISRALEEVYLLRQIARLGRLSAYERFVDWVTEMRERLSLVGLASASGFPAPLTQELMADALGLTSVHVNRTLQLMKREGLMEIRSGYVTLSDPMRLSQLADYRPTVVSMTGGPG
jgi:CRP-like cAMP-binding protein